MANISVYGVAFLEVYASTACVRASIPVAAVIDFGAVTESVGSMTASLGITFSSVISFFVSVADSVTQ